MKKLLPYLLLTAIALVIWLTGRYAQRREVITLKVHRPAQANAATVDALNEQCRNTWHYHLNQAAQYNRRALTLANKIGYLKGQAEAYHCLGVILLNMNRYDYYPQPYLQYAWKGFKTLQDKPGMAASLISLSLYFIRQNQVPKARQVLQQAQQLFNELDDTSGLGQVAYIEGEIHYQLRDFSAALQRYQQALTIQQPWGDRLSRAFTLIRLGDLYALNRQPRLALTYYQQAYRLGQLNRFNLVIINAAQALGTLSKGQSNYPEALAYYRVSLRVHQAYYGKKSPWLYQEVAEVYKAQQKYTESLTYYKSSLQAFTNEYGGKQTWWQADVCQKIAQLYRQQKKYAESIAYLYKSLDLIRPVNPTRPAYQAATIYNLLGEAYLDQGKRGEALKNASLSLQLAQSQHQPQIVQAASLTLSRIYAARRDYAQAYAYQLQYTTLRDQMLEGEIDKRAILKNDLEKNQKQDQVNLLWKEKQVQDGVLDQLHQRNYALGAGLLLFVTLVIVLIRTNRHNQQTNQLLAEQARQLEEQHIRELQQTFEHRQAETEMAALRAQMNPHFIFNCLNSIKLYATDNEADKASQYLTKFSRLIRLVLENSRSERITLSQELEALRLYLEMEAMRFKQKLCFELVAADSLDKEFIEIPPLLIQPYVENAIWHGLMHKEAGGTVWVFISQPQESTLEVRIKDDGVGRRQAAELKSKSANKGKSFGLRLTSERLALINQVYGIEAKVAIHDLTNEQGQPAGTEVVLQIPI